MRAKLVHKNAYVFDLDETLIKSNGKSYVYRNGKFLRSLTPQQYNVYVKHPDDKIDFSEFEDPNLILSAKKHKGWKILKYINKKIKFHELPSEIFVLTARHEVVKQAIYELLVSNGIDIDLDHVITMGDAAGEINIAEEKRKILSKMIKHYDQIFFYDDDIENIKLASTIPRVKPKLIKEEMSKLVSEDLGGAMGGVSAPMATVNNVPGMGNAVPASNSGIGSGDRWDSGKPRTKSAKTKLNVSKKKKKVVKLEEENLNPYDKLGNAIAKKMKIKTPFKKKREKGNQSAMVQKKFEHKIDTFDQFINERDNFERNIEPKKAMNTGGLQEFIDEFKEIWNRQYAYIGYDPSDKEILDFISKPYIKSVRQACDLFSDYILSQGLSDNVQP